MWMPDPDIDPSARRRVDIAIGIEAISRDQWRFCTQCSRSPSVKFLRRHARESEAAPAGDFRFKILSSGTANCSPGILHIAI